jgi:tetrahydromethanopterin S-methyltransferase subunit G
VELDVEAKFNEILWKLDEMDKKLDYIERLMRRT